MASIVRIRFSACPNAAFSSDSNTSFSGAIDEKSNAFSPIVSAFPDRSLVGRG
jgi:hypothetical protein